MTDPAAVAPVLPYCRSLLHAADDLQTAHRELDSTRHKALVDWQGPFSDTMRKVRRPEEVADIDIAVAALRAEADLWADAWAALVDRINWKRYDETVDAVAKRAAAFPGEAISPNPASTVPLPQRARPPVAPGYFATPSFVTYAQVDDWAYRAYYTTHESYW